MINGVGTEAHTSVSSLHRQWYCEGAVGRHGPKDERSVHRRALSKMTVPGRSRRMDSRSQADDRRSRGESHTECSHTATAMVDCSEQLSQQADKIPKQTRLRHDQGQAGSDPGDQAKDECWKVLHDTKNNLAGSVEESGAFIQS